MYGVCLKGRMHRILENANENNVAAIARDVYLYIRRLDIVDMSIDPGDIDPDRMVSIVLFGHNLGAYIAFEVARLLQSNALSSRSDCHIVATSAWGPVFRTDMNKRYIDPYEERINGKEIPCNGLCELERTTPKWTFRDLKSFVVASNLVPPCISEHNPLLKTMQTLARADIALLESYQLKPPDLDNFDIDAEKRCVRSK
jgi:surfactin synthase thioesterase subunit